MSDKDIQDLENVDVESEGLTDEELEDVAGGGTTINGNCGCSED